MKKNILLTPGPVSTSDDVKQAMLCPDVHPRNRQFNEMLKSIMHDISGLVGDPQQVKTVLFSGSATAAMESVLTSAVNNGKVFIINNGAWGQHQIEMAQALGISYHEYKSPLIEMIDMEALEQALVKAQPGITYISMVHHETTTGILNDVHAIGSLARRHGVKLIVDAVDTLGAYPVNLEKDHINFLVSASDKTLGSVPGVGLVIANRKDLLELKDTRPRNYYLNLYRQYDFFHRNHTSRFTPPVQSLFALRKALDAVLAEGVEGRYARCTASWNVLMEGLARLGLSYFVDKSHQSRLLTAIKEPDSSGYRFADMYEFCKERGFVIFPGRVPTLKSFRIANIGTVCPEDMKCFIEVLEEYLKSV